MRSVSAGNNNLIDGISVVLLDLGDRSDSSPGSDGPENGVRNQVRTGVLWRTDPTGVVKFLDSSGSMLRHHIEIAHASLDSSSK